VGISPQNTSCTYIGVPRKIHRYTRDTVFKTGLGESRITARITPSAIASTIEEAVSYKVFTRPTFKTRAMAASRSRAAVKQGVSSADVALSECGQPVFDGGDRFCAVLVFCS
jgi:hypothetical protein